MVYVICRIALTIIHGVPTTWDADLETHSNASMVRADDFDQFIIDRAKRLLDAIQIATGKTISGRNSDDVIAAYGAAFL